MKFANAVVDSCTSTNDLAKRLGEAGYPSGTWVAAKEQTGGRGRNGRRWVSQPENLALSIVFRIEPQGLWSWIPLAAAAGVLKAVHSLDPKLEDLIRVKWPNDLLMGDAKLGGILSEAVSGKNSFQVVGIGLNTAFAPRVLGQKTAALGLDVDVVRPAVVNFVTQGLEQLVRSGPGSVIRAYQRWGYFREGDPVRVMTQEAGDEQSGWVEPLGSSGEFRVRLAAGKVKSFYSDSSSIRPVG